MVGPEGYFDEQFARRYDESVADTLQPAAVDAAVDFIAAFPGADERTISRSSADSSSEAPGRGRRLEPSRRAPQGNLRRGAARRLDRSPIYAESQVRRDRITIDALQLAGQKVAVIGGSSGIGLETARCARDQRESVIITACDPDRRRRVGLELATHLMTNTAVTGATFGIGGRQVVEG